MSESAILDNIVGLCSWLESGGTAPPITEFLGDLYQLHCEQARKGRALVQTPEFVRSFILDRTLGVVLAKWGPMAAKTIDPSCGCGHFLVDAFRRTFAAWAALPPDDLHGILMASGGYDPGDDREAVIAQIALDQVVGVDLDPVCVAISRVRLLFEAWAASDVRMPYRIQVYEGDALLHHRPLPTDDAEFGPWRYDVDAVRRAMAPGQYTAVVANPPYIRCSDPKLRAAYGARYPTCGGQYHMSVPFTEVCFGLAVSGDRGAVSGGDTTKGPAAVREHQGVLFATGDAA